MRPIGKLKTPLQRKFPGTKCNQFRETNEERYTQRNVHVDVQRNLGPIKFPCSICFKPVRSNQKAMLCDCCNLWCHCKCSSVSMSEYAAVFQSMGEAVSWICNGCYVRVMPFAECSTLGSTKSVRPRSRVSSLSTSSGPVC